MFFHSLALKLKTAAPSPLYQGGHLPTLPLWFHYLANVSEIVIAAGTVAIFFLTMRLTFRVKQADVLIEFCRRYDHLLFERERFVSGTSAANAAFHFERYWLLQWDQYNFWKKNSVDHRMYEMWLSKRHNEQVQNQSIGGVAYRDAWRTAKTNIQGSGFRVYQCHGKGICRPGARVAEPLALSCSRETGKWRSSFLRV